MSNYRLLYGARRWTSITRKLFFYLGAEVSHGRSHLRAVKQPQTGRLNCEENLDNLDGNSRE